MKNYPITYLKNSISREEDAVKALRVELENCKGKKGNKGNKDKKEYLKSAIKKIEKSIYKLEKAIALIEEIKKIDEAEERVVKPKKVNLEKKEVKPIPGATYADSVEFKDITSVNIDKNVGELPVIASLKCKNKFNCEVLVNINKTYVLKSGSIICIGYINGITKDASWAKLRARLIEKDSLKKIKDGKSNKYILKEDVLFSTKNEMLRFILGRPLNPYDNNYSFNVGDISVDRYLHTGNYNDNEQ